MNRVIDNFPTPSYPLPDEPQSIGLTSQRQRAVSPLWPSNNWLHKSRLCPRFPSAYKASAPGEPRKQLLDFNSRQDGERPCPTCVHG